MSPADILSAVDVSSAVHTLLSSLHTLHDVISGQDYYRCSVVVYFFGESRTCSVKCYLFLEVGEVLNIYRENGRSEFTKALALAYNV